MWKTGCTKDCVIPKLVKLGTKKFCILKNLLFNFMTSHAVLQNKRMSKISAKKLLYRLIKFLLNSDKSNQDSFGII